MKTKEFIRKVEGLGYSVRKGMSYLAVCNEMGYVLAMISTERQYEFSCYYNIGFENQLFHLIVDYAGTPPECRQEEKKFYLKHKYFRHVNDKQYFTIYPHLEYPQLDYKLPSHNLVQTFTLKEMEVIKKKYNTDLSDFEKKEVRE